MHPFLVALSICVVAGVAEVAAAGKDPTQCLRSLRQPRWAPPRWSWYLVGILYYSACLVSLYLVLQHDPSLAIRWRALELLLVVLVFNTVWNVTLFRLRAVGLSFWLFLPYTALVIYTVLILYKVDGEAAAPFIPYLIYLGYGCAWLYSTWTMNRAAGSPPP